MPPAMLPSDSDAETAASEADSLVPLEAPKGSLPAGKLCLAAVLLGAGAALAWAGTFSRPGSASEWRGEVASKEELQGLLLPRKGCGNWMDVMLMDPLEGMDASSCASKCANTSGCFWSNIGYQCADPSVKPGACFLFSVSCQIVDNNCWDLQAAPGPPGPIMNTSRMGCSNWADIQIDLLSGKNMMECATICGNTPGCKQINFQPGPCSGDQMVGEGACYLFKEGCVMKSNACWDLYDVVSPDDTLASSGVSADARAGDTELSVASASGFPYGSTASIVTTAGSTQDVRVEGLVAPGEGRRLAAGKLRISPLPFDVPAGSMVYRVRTRQFDYLVDRILEKAFENVTSLGSVLAAPVPADPSWLECTSESWDEVEREHNQLEIMKELLNILGCDAQRKEDATCYALKATYTASLWLTDRFSQGPLLASYLVTNWGNYTSWETGAVLDVSYARMPPTARVVKGNGLVMYGVCEAVRTVLLQSPNQVNTGTCGWVSTLGALTAVAPAKALKMAVRLTWTARAAPQLPPPCGFISEQFPGLIPYIDGHGKIRPELAADMSWDWSYTCGGNPTDCKRQAVQPLSPAGVAGMWIYTSIMAYWQSQQNVSCAEANGQPGLIYPNMTKTQFKDNTELHGQGPAQGLWSCNAQLDPVGKGCSIAFNEDALCGPLDSTACRENVLDLQQRNVPSKLFWVPSFTEKMLREACSAKVALVTLDAAPLQGGEPDGKCDHAVALVDCDHDADAYTMWTWGQRINLTRAQIVGKERYSLSFVAEKAGLSEAEVAEYARSTSAFGGCICGVILAQNISFAQV